METADLVQVRTATEPQSPVSTEPQPPASAAQGVACSMGHGSGSPSQSGLAWLGKYRGWVWLGSAAIAGTGLALGEGWVTFAGLAPLLYSLPCAAMMVFCMKGMSSGMQKTQDQNPAPPPPSDGNPRG